MPNWNWNDEKNFEWQVNIHQYSPSHSVFQEYKDYYKEAFRKRLHRDPIYEKRLYKQSRRPGEKHGYNAIFRKKNDIFVELMMQTNLLHIPPDDILKRTFFTYVAKTITKSDIDDIDDFIPVNGSLRLFLLKDKIQKYVTAWNIYPNAQMFDEF